jgi:hypothetical protein
MVISRLSGQGITVNGQYGQFTVSLGHQKCARTNDNN